MTTSAPAPMMEEGRLRTNVLARHWRGALPLWVSFWIVGFGLCVVVAVAVPGMLFALAALDTGLSRDGTILVILLTAVAQLAALVFACVGTWRAATRHIRSCRERGRTTLWGWAAKACVAVVAFLTYVGPLQKIAGG
jgi:hypothetical protein